MLFNSVRIAFVLFFVDAFGREQSSGSPNVDHIFDNLSNQQWDPDEAPCRDRIFDILKNVKNSTFWATWIWNSMEQSPTGLFFGARYHVGNYDQCLRPPWLATHPQFRTQYCLAEIEMNDGVKTMDQVTDPYVRAENYYLDTKSLTGLSFSYFAHGVCVPAGCPHKSAARLVKALLSAGYLRAAHHAAVSIHHCEEAGAPHHYSKGFYVYICSIAALLFITVASTYYLSKYPAIAKSSSFASRIVKSFNLRRNWNAILKDSHGDLNFLNGIRFLLATLITLLHLGLLASVTSVINALDLELAFTRYYIAHCEILTDGFLAMSGLLLGNKIATLDVTKPYNLLIYILQRYIRIVGVLAVSVFYLTHVSIYTDDGPVYPKLAGYEQQMCEKNWWLTLLLIGNYFNASEMCFSGTWQVCCDFQLHVMTLILLYVYRKNENVGKAAAALVVVVGFLSPPITTYIYDLPAIVTLNIGLDINIIRKNPSLLNGYIQTHNRMGAYIVGLVVGYYMSIYEPKDHKKVWSKTKSFAGVCASLSLMFVVLWVGSLCHQHRVYGLMAAAYMTFDRTMFAVGVLGIIVFLAYGDVPFVKSFLSWSVFGKFHKVSYGLYLISLVLQFRSKTSLRSHWKFHAFDMFTESQGQLVVSLVLSLAVYLLVEAPLVNITGSYINTGSSKTSEGKIKNEVDQNGTTEQKIK